MSDLDKDDVVSVGPKSPSFGLGSTFKLGELLQTSLEWIASMNNGGAHAQWFTPDGVRCKVLRTNGGGWKSGKIRFRVEFILDEPEFKPKEKPGEPDSPLADLRSNLDI